MLERLKRRLPDAADGMRDALLNDLIEDAGRMIRAYTGRNTVPEALEGAQLELAAIFFNRMGMEGESAHAEGEMHRSAADLPEHLRRQLNPYRRAAAIGR